MFDLHMKLEFVDRDVEATMETMTDEPYVHNVATLTGGQGQRGVREFYTKYLVGKMPEDMKLIPISRTVGRNQVVDEFILCFTHDVPIEFMLPGITPTGKYVELPLIAVIGFEGNKIAQERIYWDQASLLAQVGLLDSQALPVRGAEQPRRLLEITQKA